MTTAQRIGLKRLHRRREIDARLKCHGSVFNHATVHPATKKAIILPRASVVASSLWRRFINWLKSFV